MSHQPHSRAAGPPVRFTALAAVALLAFATALIATPRQANAAEYDPAFLSGHLDWGVKESFRDYIGKPFVAGDIEVSDGATVNDDGSFCFPLYGGGDAAEANRVEAQMKGSVRFRGHRIAGEWALWMKFSDPMVIIDHDAEVGALVADVESRDESSGDLEKFPHAELVELDIDAAASANSDPSGGGIWEAVPSYLTEEGSEVFSERYPDGEAMDPVHLLASTSSAAAGCEEEGDGGGSDETSGDPAPSPDGEGSDPPSSATAGRPLVKRLGGRMRPVTRNGVASLALVGCRPPRPCLLRTRRFAAVKVGRRTFRARVLAPGAVKAGGWASVRLWLSPRPRRALAARHGRVMVPVVVRSGGRRIVRRVGALLRSVPARGGRGRAAR